MGVLVGKGGFYGNVFRITPPLCFTREDAGKFCSQLEKIVFFSHDLRNQNLIPFFSFYENKVFLLFVGRDARQSKRKMRLNRT